MLRRVLMGSPCVKRWDSEQFYLFHQEWAPALLREERQHIASLLPCDLPDLVTAQMVMYTPIRNFLARLHPFGP